MQHEVTNSQNPICNIKLLMIRSYMIHELTKERHPYLQHEITNDRDPICNMRLPIIRIRFVT